MSIQEKTIRFVHAPAAFFNNKKYSGLTIAYYRTARHVVFGYSLVCKPDQYSKETGRNLSANALNAVSDIYVNTCNADEWFIDSGMRTGMINIETMIDATGINYTLGDHFTKAMTMMDFKHAPIMGVLETVVKNVIENS